MLNCFLKIRVKTATFLLVLTSIVFVTGVFLIYFILLSVDDDTVDDVSKFPVLLWWTPFILESIKIIDCQNTFKCVLTKDRANFKNDPNLAAYLFYGSNFNVNDLPLPKGNIPWAIFHEESPKNLALFLNAVGQNLFNISSTFSRNSDFPVPLQYLRNLDVILDKKYYVPVNKKNELLNNIAPVLYVQSDCDTPIERDLIVKELMKYVEVDSYGACLNNKHLPEKYSINAVFEDLYNSDFTRFVAQYKFTIAIENAICDDYVTEKLWRPLIAGSIPIYLGSPSIQDWLPNNNSAILVQNYKDLSQLADHINEINKNDDLYNQYMLHKIENKVTNSFLKSELEKGDYGIKYDQDFAIPAFECFVCETVHKNSYKVHNKLVYDCKTPTSLDSNSENWWKMHWRIGGCQARALNYFLNILRLDNFTEKMFSNQYEKYLNNNDC